MKTHELGGTLIGFVAGLLVGLGLALAVALYVTKVPVPFVDRGVSRKATQDAIEAERNRNWNPNAAIGGRSTNAPAPAQPAGAEDAPAITAPGVAAPAGSTDPAAAPTASTDPLGDLMRARASSGGGSAVASVTVPANDPFVYFVQAGAFRTQADADAQRARLAMLGLDARVTEREQSGQTVFRVRVGPFDHKTDADAAQAKLVAGGQEAALVRVQR